MFAVPSSAHTVFEQLQLSILVLLATSICCCLYGCSSNPVPDVPVKSALIVVDMQNDFINGSLTVQNASSIIPTINALTGLRDWDQVIFTTDFHPQNHISFAVNNPLSTSPFTSVDVQYDASGRICGAAYADQYGESCAGSCAENDVHFNFSQELWPPHCIQGSHGQRIDSRVNIPESAAIVRKGISSVIDSYGAFTNNVGMRMENPMGVKLISENTMEEMLVLNGIENVFVTGLALDYCVKYTALQAVQRKFSTTLIVDATKPVFESAGQEAITELKDAGVKVVASSSLIGPA